MIARQSSVCFRTLHLAHPYTLECYRRVGGYVQWERILKEKPDLDGIIDNLKRATLRGRGGADFPTGLKRSFMRRSAPKQARIVCNSDAGELGTCKTATSSSL